MWLWFAMAAGCVLARPTLPNGQQLLRFEVRAPGPAVAGSAVGVEMTLKDDSGQRMQIVNSTSNAINRGFGHANEGLALAPGARVAPRASRVLDAANEWIRMSAGTVEDQRQSSQKLPDEKVPQTMQEPVLVVVTHQGGNPCEHAGIRLY